MHRHPDAIVYLTAIRHVVGRADDPDVREAAGELIARLEEHFRSHTLSKQALLTALDAFQGIRGADASVAALRAIASRPEPE